MVRHVIHLFFFSNIFAGLIILGSYFVEFNLNIWIRLGIYGVVVMVLFVLALMTSFYEYFKPRPLSQFNGIESDFKFYSRLAELLKKGTVSRSELLRYHAEYRNEISVERARRGSPTNGCVDF
ncbi:hypothetical protein [Pseudomonas sp. GXZC]|uniref:hypothetical protein n=1 Tax=Pseudomonas sp. GXZC TaxID=3003351 RepID=UPI0022AB4AD0|nr:hypothetical protein [Pseudomonas sp. GXZC]WAT32143.1 hypothetical protein OZ428_34345 [Pseudomonas sp. GXZC]